ncbi:MAG: site-specific integrase [Muribaculaceae bacterium]|nr:site-specific integrase [Muribaculaceae bacterium]
MATVKVKLRPSSVEGKAGVIYYQITHNRKTQQITTRLRVHPLDWDADEEKMVQSAPNCSMIQNRIDSDVTLLKRVILDLDNSGVDYCVNDVINRYKSPQSHILVLDYMHSQIEQLRASNRLGTAKNYEKTMCSFREFLDGVKLPLSAMTEQVVTDYNSFLIKRGLVRNSVSFYMRVLRAIYNKAVRQKLIEQQHPFTEVYTGIDRTRKRAVSESIIAQLHRLELEAGTPLGLCRDMFIFSYCTRGMAFVDIAYLKKSNLQNGMICYARRKTGQLLSVRIEPSIQRIIDRYIDSDSPYVFPILNSLDANEAYEQYQVALNTHNRLLGRLSEILGCGCKLTSYTSRHSWATAARNHNVPISVISQGMGHTSEQTTQIYLTMLENSVIDEANKGIIGDLL